MPSVTSVWPCQLGQPAAAVRAQTTRQLWAAGWSCVRQQALLMAPNPSLQPLPQSLSASRLNRHVLPAGITSQPCQRGACIARAALAAGGAPAAGLLPVSGPWGVWAVLIACGTFGLWSEKNTRIGKELSGALMATLAGMVMANVGVIPAHAPELSVVYKYILPLAIPMLLFSADLKRMLSETGRLLLAFLLGSAMTLLGSAVAMLVFPLGPWMGDTGWRVATALTARHIGGAVNYMAVTDTLKLPPSVFGAGLAADDLILTIYFTTIYALAKNVPPDPAPATPATATADAPAGPIPAAATDAAAALAGGASPPVVATDGGGGHSGPVRSIQVLPGLMALSLSSVICYIATAAAHALGAADQSLTLLTTITVAAATLLPRALAPLVPSAEGLAQVLMQIFYATIGASADVGLVVKTAPILFCFCAIALSVHLGGLLVVGKALGFSRRELLIASNANIGGPSTVAGMAAAKGWTLSIVPGILTSTLGYAIGNFLGLALGYNFLAKI